MTKQNQRNKTKCSYRHSLFSHHNIIVTIYCLYNLCWHLGTSSSRTPLYQNFIFFVCILFLNTEHCLVSKKFMRWAEVLQTFSSFCWHRVETCRGRGASSIPWWINWKYRWIRYIAVCLQFNIYSLKQWIFFNCFWHLFKCFSCVNSHVWV